MIFDDTPIIKCHDSKSRFIGSMSNMLTILYYSHSHRKFVSVTLCELLWPTNLCKGNKRKQQRRNRKQTNRTTVANISHSISNWVQFVPCWSMLVSAVCRLQFLRVAVLFEGLASVPATNSQTRIHPKKRASRSSGLEKIYIVLFCLQYFRTFINILDIDICQVM